MRTSAKILRTIGSWLSRLDWAYAGPRQPGPGYYYYRYYHPYRSDEGR
jgi:hypothetical protein